VSNVLKVCDVRVGGLPVIMWVLGVLLLVISKKVRFAAQGMGSGATKRYPQTYFYTSPSGCHSPHPRPVTLTVYFTAIEVVLTTFVRSTGICHRGLKENLAEGEAVEAWSAPSVPSVERLSVNPV